MDFQGSVELKASRTNVWVTIRNPTTIASALPDFKDLAIQSPTAFTGNAKVGVSFIRGTFRFRFEVSEERPPEFLELKARGNGIGSSVDITTRVTLSETPSGATRMVWEAKAQVGGSLAGIAQRMLQQAAERTVEEIFANLTRLLESSG